MMIKNIGVSSLADGPIINKGDVFEFSGSFYMRVGKRKGIDLSSGICYKFDYEHTALEYLHKLDAVIYMGEK